MSIGTIISLMRGAVTQVISMVAPVLGLALLVGLIVAILAMVLYGALKYRSSVLGKKIMKCCTALELHANGGETR